MNPSSQRSRPGPVLSHVTVCILAASLIGSAAMGSRQTFGLFVEPLSFGYGFPITLVAFAIAMHNLVWGIAQPVAGAVADRHGAGRVVTFGAVALAAGLALTAMATTGAMLVLGMGVFVGIGISCTSFGVVLSAVGRAAAPEKRGTAMGLASAGGSFGQVLLVPLAQGVSDHSGTAASLFVLAACALAVAPLGIFLDRNHGPHGPTQEAEALPLRAAVAQALGNNGYCLLTLGFFTCGFQLAFIVTHLPAYLTLCQMPAGLGAVALALIGLFNILGSWGCGWLGDRFRQQHLLAWIYLIRGAAIAAFFVLPKTELLVMVFAAVMGLAWLGTVPLTNGLIAKVFGTRHLGTLFGVCFLSHQIGSFLGSWMGGVVFELTGSYSIVWIATAAAGLVAAILHFPINDTPMARTGAATA